ncbi:hypothetical protein N7539_006234 [Penicillium diatomitis]|uniref:Uncharacterized protein n=1 Tax=Penicillium diatomitis TaxID=2819901 RepID=A0A9W9X312_9EURO|nr:uncharacterized protein N7539_006234 [Penicillium diatomitis]KAJ5482788.1 hypothetical protein N7539_006234 [Penicillium diatomitis]
MPGADACEELVLVYIAQRIPFSGVISTRLGPGYTWAGRTLAEHYLTGVLADPSSSSLPEHGTYGSRDADGVCKSQGPAALLDLCVHPAPSGLE